MATVGDDPVHLDQVRMMAERLPHMLRGDAQSNRDRILEAARALFAEQGIDVTTMRAISRRAQVGPATLYRRFPTKQLLIDEAFAGELQRCRAIVDQGCADADPWRGFCFTVKQLTLLNVRNQGFVDAFMSANPGTDTFTEHRGALVQMLTALSRRAKAAGHLRRDFVIDDLILVLLACRGLASTPPGSRKAAASRLGALAIEAFRASNTNEALPRPAPLAAGVTQAVETHYPTPIIAR